MAESLLPDTDAISKNTIEWVKYRGKHFVRYKDAAGSAHRVHTADCAEAEKAFEKYKAQMAAEARRNDSLTH